jgi:hypothetical protein
LGTFFFDLPIGDFIISWAIFGLFGLLKFKEYYNIKYFLIYSLYMKKVNELNEKELKELREQFKQKHDRSILFNDGSIFSRIRDFLRSKGCIPTP